MLLYNIWVGVEADSVLGEGEEGGGGGGGGGGGRRERGVLC